MNRQPEQVCLWNCILSRPETLQLGPIDPNMSNSYTSTICRIIIILCLSFFYSEQLCESRWIYNRYHLLWGWKRRKILIHTWRCYIFEQYDVKIVYLIFNSTGHLFWRIYLEDSGHLLCSKLNEKPWVKMVKE